MAAHHLVVDVRSAVAPIAPAEDRTCQSPISFTTSLAEIVRRTGSLFSVRSTMRVIASGTSARTLSSAAGVCDAAASIIAGPVSPWNGSRPASIS